MKLGSLRSPRLADDVRKLGEDDPGHGQLDAGPGAGHDQNRRVRPISPPTARLSMQAGPISAKLSMRNSSPKPGRGRVSEGASPSRTSGRVD